MVERERDYFMLFKIRKGVFANHVPQFYTAILKQIWKRELEAETSSTDDN